MNAATTRVERILIGVFLAVACPLSLMVIGWWTSAALTIYGIAALPEETIALAAFAGLGLGLFLDLLFVRRWIGGFYRVDLRLAVTAYLFWTAVSTAWFMGLPFGNLALGTLAGAYLGRRARHHLMSAAAFTRIARNGSLFASLATGAAALGIGILAVREPYTLAPVRSAVGFGQYSQTAVIDATIVAAACVLLVILQYDLSSFAASTAFRASGD